MAGLSDIAAALVRLADAADRAVFLGEAWSVAMGVIHPDQVGLMHETDDDGEGWMEGQPDDEETDGHGEGE